MVQAATKALISVDDYLFGERDGEQRHEFVNGEVFAMTGSSAAHNLIAGNLFAALHVALAGKCQLFMNDMKVRYSNARDERYYYPDILLSCEENEPDPYYREHPCMIVEVLSPSTERTDRSDKFFAYRRIPSLMEYVLVAQD
ncbi:MAG: Uma2 family endonuclease, partial [Gammaproteobacteria bacterium]